MSNAQQNTTPGTRHGTYSSINIVRINDGCQCPGCNGMLGVCFGREWQFYDDKPQQVPNLSGSLSK